MRLLLTSAGLRNDSLRDAVKKLVPGEINIAFIPTAANIEEGEKDWLITDLVDAQKVGEVDIVDISALPKDVWRKRLEAANVIFVGGGNTFYLLHWVRESGLAELLPELLKTRLYVGISAGSIITCPSMATSTSKRVYFEKTDEGGDIKGLGYVDFQVLPHMGSPYFPEIREDKMQDLANEIGSVVYGLDDDSALLVDNGVSVISEGKWVKCRKI